MAAQFAKLVDFTSDRLNVDAGIVKYGLMFSSALPVAVSMYGCLSDQMHRRQLNKRRSEFQTEVRSKVEQLKKDVEQKITQEKALQITSLSFDDLSAQLQSGQLTCLTVLNAYQRIAIINNDKLNFITEPVEDAEERAKELDKLTPDERKKMLLFGVPMSVKENYNLANYVSSYGCAEFLNEKKSKTAANIQALVAHGAVPFIRTNIPQTMMSLGSHNPVYGLTRNPLDSTRSPGGSSAGEGSAIGSGASMFGMGSDIGGSVRVPAAWCGIYSLKPTTGRFSCVGMSKAIHGQMAVRGTSGVMSRDMGSLLASSKALMSDEQFQVDGGIPPMPFNQKEYDSKDPLTIGFCLDLLPINTTESTKQAIVKIMTELESQGHKIVKYDIPQTGLSPDRLTLISYFGDRGAQLLRTLRCDEVSHVIKPMYDTLRLPLWLKSVMCAVLGVVNPKAWVYRFLYSLAGVQNMDQWFLHQDSIAIYRQAWLDDWKAKGIDVVVSPSVPVPAEILSGKKPTSGCGSYVYLYNLVNFPAGCVPFGEITAEEEENDLLCYPEDSLIHRNMKLMVAGSAGMVKSVQCAALPFREEKCLRVMSLISKMSTD